MVRISDMFHCLFVQAIRENSDCNSNYRGASTIRYTYPTVAVGVTNVWVGMQSNVCYFTKVLGVIQMQCHEEIANNTRSRVKFEACT